VKKESSYTLKYKIWEKSGNYENQLQSCLTEESKRKSFGAKEDQMDRFVPVLKEKAMWGRMMSQPLQRAEGARRGEP